MEGRKTAKERSLSRSWEGQRLEQQILAMAYEELWPVVRRRLPGPPDESARRSRTPVQLQQAQGG
jgi:hypothetical protein